jgi:hypothetical protein
MMGYFPFQNFDDSLLYDLESEEELDEPLNVLNPSCYDIYSDMVDNIYEFIHVGRCKWDVFGYDVDPIYDTENHFQVFPLQLSQQVTLNFDEWKQGDGMIINTLQTPRVDLVPCYPDDFWSYRHAQILIGVRTLFSQRWILVIMFSNYLRLLYLVVSLKV